MNRQLLARLERPSTAELDRKLARQTERLAFLCDNPQINIQPQVKGGYWCYDMSNGLETLAVRDSLEETLDVAMVRHQEKREKHPE